MRIDDCGTKNSIGSCIKYYRNKIGELKITYSYFNGGSGW